MKLIKNLCWVFMLLAFLTSCEKELVDLQPIDQIPAEKAIKTLADLTSAVNGVYGTWAARRSVYISALISDEVRLGFGGEYRNVGNVLYNWQFVSDSQDWRDAETGGVWTNLYAVIDRANRAIEFGTANVPSVTVADISLKNQLIGELTALRAMAHLELLRCFSISAEYNPTALGVVLQNTFVKNVSIYRPRRNTQKEVIDFITADLIAAKALIPTSFIDIGRVTRNAVIGAQVRVAMHIKDWPGVVDRANEIIPLQPLTPRLSYAGLWTTRALGANQTTEVIWKLNISPANSGAAIGTLFQDANTAQQAAPSAKLLATYDQLNDVRFSTFFRTAPRNLIAKYGFLPLAGETFLYDIKMMRTSEMVLARAEAYAELNNLPAANADLSLLRTNRIAAYVHTNITSIAAMVTAILQERYKELCYEGQRYFDLRRRSLPIVRDASDIGGITTSQTLPPTDNKYILPIPQQEKLANPNIEQNIGY